MDRHLILISGGGFSTEENSYIDYFSMNLCPQKEKNIVIFIPTASHDALNYIEKFHQSFSEHETYHLTKDKLKNTELLEKADLIYIGGGDTKYMLNTWKETGFDHVLMELYNQGKVIVGISAGATCWFTHIYEHKQLHTGLGLLKGSLCPHYNIGEEETIMYDEWSNKTSNIIHYRLNDNENLYVKNDKIISKITVL